MIYVPRPIIVPQRQKRIDVNKYKLFTASEVEDMIVKAIEIISGSEIIQKKRDSSQVHICTRR